MQHRYLFPLQTCRLLTIHDKAVVLKAVRKELYIIMSTPSIKLTYFDLEGRGECVRLALTLADVPFEDVRVKFPEWPELKQKTPSGKLPVIEVDNGPMKAQSGAMLRWIGTKFSKTLYPADRIFEVEEAIG